MSLPIAGRDDGRRQKTGDKRDELVVVCEARAGVQRVLADVRCGASLEVIGKQIRERVPRRQCRCDLRICDTPQQKTTATGVAQGRVRRIAGGDACRSGGVICPRDRQPGAQSDDGVGSQLHSANAGVRLGLSHAQALGDDVDVAAAGPAGLVDAQACGA